jgi:hypothetical protein
MSESIDRMETLQVVHELQSMSKKATDAIDFKVENATDTTVECRIDTLELISELIKTQSNIIAKYAEHDASVADAIETLTEVLTK